MLTSQLVKLALKLINLGSQCGNSLVSILFDFVDANDLPFEGLSLFEQLLVHLLYLVTLHLILLFERKILLQCELKMRFLGLQAINDGFLRLLDEHELAHFLVLVLYLQILLFYGLLRLEKFLLDDRVSSYLLVTLDLQRFDSFVLVVDLGFMLDFEGAQIDHLIFDQIILFFHAFLAEF